MITNHINLNKKFNKNKIILFKKALLCFIMILFFCYGFLFIINKNQIMAIKTQKNDIEHKIRGMRLELWMLLKNQQQLEEQINFLRYKTEYKKKLVELEKEYYELKIKIATLYQDIAKSTKKVTFNLRPLIKIIE
ncbi:MAG: SVM family protein [Vigna little leaf phytoplasma]|nr:SVM family protein [Vigna little leaf phytoplasma]